MGSGASSCRLSSISGPRTVLVSRVGLAKDPQHQPLPRSEEQDALKFEQACPLYPSEIRIYDQEVARRVRVLVAALADHEMNVGVGEGL